ncbi:MAG: protein-L-isoaspartate O-methyltransferase [Rhodospirillaceae bacterium]|nr:protein-L-isoaspartate O-methyltransferase [Rhodospirillaceae bacterium]
MQEYATARHNMVEGQIKPNRVTDAAVMDAMREVPRELFVPTIARGVAYVDEDIRIADGRFLMEPMVLARLLDAAAVRRDDIVLDIGCGTGYSTAVLARLANTVVALESDGELARGASELLVRLGVDNAVIVEGPLTEGYPAQAPYQVIVLGGAVDHVPDGILAQLDEGGRLVTVIVPDLGRPAMGCATLFRRIHGHVSSRPLFDAGTPMLPGFEPLPTFQF